MAPAAPERWRRARQAGGRGEKEYAGLTATAQQVRGSLLPGASDAACEEVAAALSAQPRVPLDAQDMPVGWGIFERCAPAPGARRPRDAPLRGPRRRLAASGRPWAAWTARGGRRRVPLRRGAGHLRAQGVRGA